MPSEEGLHQEQRKRLEEQIKKLSGKNKDLHYLAIRELEGMANNPDLREELKLFICKSLCQYLSKHPDSRPVIDVLFKRNSKLCSVKKEIKDANFVRLKLSGLRTIENVNFVNCKFYDCHFHKIYFRNCNMHGGEICDCVFKDKIKLKGCFFKNVHINNSKFRHVLFSDFQVRGGMILSSVFVLSEFSGVSFFDLDMENTTFQLCEFQMEDFSQCQMSNIKFELKKEMWESLEKMQEYLLHMGYHPCVERSSMIISV